MIIKNPSSYYVDQINGVLTDTIKEGKGCSPSGLRFLFLTIAAMEGDLDNGKSKVETLREVLGEELFDTYRREQPEKFEYLLKLDEGE